MNVSRRNFLKTAASMGAAGVLAGTAATALADQPPAGDGEAPAAEPAGGAPGGGPGDMFGGGASLDVEAAKANAKAEGRVFGYCGPGDWLGEAPVIDEADIVETVETDVLVIGGGHAGTMAAVGAIDEGAKVVLVETQSWDAFVDLDNAGINKVGWFGEDIGHVNSKYLIEHGFGPYNPGEIAYEFVKRSLGRCDPDIIAAYVKNSGAMFDRQCEIYESYEQRRIEEDSAVFFEHDKFSAENVTHDCSNMLADNLCCIQQQLPEANVEYPIVNGDYKTWPCVAQFYGWSGNAIEMWSKYLTYYIQDSGGTILFRHTAQVLTTDDDGRVTGAIVEDLENGGYKKIVVARGVVIAAGDFLGNPDMCWALLNEGMEWAERQGYTKDTWTTSTIRNGQGIKMACWAGAQIQQTPRAWMINGGGTKGPWGNAPLLQLNCEGKRYYNEGGLPTVAIIDKIQPEGLSCYVTDANFLTTIAKASLDHGSVNFGDWPYAYDFVADMLNIEVDNPEGGQVVESGMGGYGGHYTVYAASTLEKLAEFLGYEGEAAENFVKSVERYNEFCANGADEDYGKEPNLLDAIVTPPFYGGTGSLSSSMKPSMVTLAGVIGDEEMRVLREGKTNNPIPGLYAAGNSLGRRYGLQYVTPMAGNSIGFAMTTGWLAGKNAANQI